jgi:hypothetical protein
MVKSKLYFMVFEHTGLTGGTHRSDRSRQDVPIFGANRLESLQVGKIFIEPSNSSC